MIEVLIAVVVLATGLLALTALQGALIRNSADAKARSQLAAYAQSLMDDARQQGYGSIPVSPTTPGALLSTSTGNSLASAAQAMGVSNLTEASTVAEVVNGTSTYKVVNLRLNWNDVTGAPRNLRLTSVISPLLLVQNLLNDLEPPDTGSYRPIVRRPSPVTEGMIPIAVGNGEDTAATNPKPELIGRNDDTLVSDTRFELLTFNGSEGLQSGYARFDKRIETAMVGCTCQTGLNGFPTGGSSPEINVVLRAKAFRPSYWNGTRYAEPEDAGTPNRSPDDSVEQSQLCDVCCRDHQDSGTVTGPRFNPWSGTHNHYLDIAGSAVTNGTFREACRVVRVDGVWRVTPDPKVQDVALLPTQIYPSTTGSTTAPSDNNSATSPLVSAAGRTNYIAFVYDFISQFFYSKTALNSANLASMQTSAGLNNPEYVPIKSGDTRWLHARAILTDFLEPDAIGRIDNAITDCTGGTAVLRAQCVLPYVPMATVNATELAEWSGQATSETGITHTGTLALGTTLKNYGQALLRRFISGLALVGAISPTDDDDPVKDEQTFALVPGVLRTGTWLSVASPSDVLFGDAANPTRGFATIAAPTTFNVTLSGIGKAHDNDLGNDPLLNVGIVSPAPCSHPTARGAYSCATESSSNVVLAFGGMNYLKTTGLTGPNVASGCAGTTTNVGKQAKCVYYSLTRLNVDGTNYTPAQASYALVSGTLTRPSEVSSVTIPSVVTSTPASEATLTFTENERNATQVCSLGGTSGTFAGWTCD